ncbi:hypothetical protein B0H14DRAFT_3442354 [Mycena olivaceomarginata]|nr:hypothetical protein B0H14DRAFT_3442354 [Mycena olivaceomarginata]
MGCDVTLPQETAAPSGGVVWLEVDASFPRLPSFLPQCDTASRVMRHYSRDALISPASLPPSFLPHSLPLLCLLLPSRPHPYPSPTLPPSSLLGAPPSSLLFLPPPSSLCPALLPPSPSSPFFGAPFLPAPHPLLPPDPRYLPPSVLPLPSSPAICMLTPLLQPFTSPPTNESTFLCWTVRPFYYSALTMEEAIGHSNNTQVLNYSVVDLDLFTLIYGIYEVFPKFLHSR